MMYSKSLISSALAAMLALASQAAFAQVAVVVGAKSPVGPLTEDQVSGVYLGKTNTLPGGGAAALADLPDSNPARDHFYTKATGKNGAQVKATWARLTFSGKGVPPKEMATSADVKKFVAGNPNAIGYIEKSAVDPSVKVVLSLD